jgi:hypothetical protein
MTSNNQRWRVAPPTLWRTCQVLICLLLGACANTPPQFDESGQLPILDYYQVLSRMSSVELGRERSVLLALPATPNAHLRLAMLLAYPKAAPDLVKAISLLDGVLKGKDPESVSLHSLARLLADNYIERQKQEAQLDRQGGVIERQGAQLKENQKKVVELQEKIDGLADIERNLPSRARSGRVAPAKGGIQ